MGLYARLLLQNSINGTQKKDAQLYLYASFFGIPNTTTFYYITFFNQFQEIKDKSTNFLRITQNVFVTFVYFGYCNFSKNVLYYSHIKEVQSDGKVR